MNQQQQQQQQQQNNQFNQYMNNNVGAPASTVTENIVFLTQFFIEWQFNGCFIRMKILLFGSLSKPAGLV